MDSTAKKLLDLVKPGHAPEVRVSALRVMAELGMRDREAAETLCASLEDKDAFVRVVSLEAASKLHFDKALPILLERVTQGGEESELAALAAAKLGAKGAKALKDLMSKVAPGLRRRIAGALGAAGTASGNSAAVESLLDSDPGVIDAAARTLSAEIHSLNSNQRRQLGEQFIELLNKSRKKAPLSEPSESAIVRLLATLNDPHAESALWERTQAPHPPALRAAALQALGPAAHAAGKENLQRLQRCAQDSDFRVAAPALMILQSLPANSKLAPIWLSLMQATDVAVRRAAIKRIGDHDKSEVAAGLVEQLNHRDAGLRDESLQCLSRLTTGRSLLADHLLKADTPDKAWSLARAQTAWAAEFDANLRKRLYEKATKYLQDGDRRGEAFLHVLRAGNPLEVNRKIHEHAVLCLKKKNYESAQKFLRLLTRDPACGPLIRLDAAGCNLKHSAKDLHGEARAADPCLDQFTSLLHAYPNETLEFVKKTKWLVPEDLFYVGFHFAEKDRQEKEFGGQVLRLVIAKAGRTKIGKEAKSKLVGEGLA